ncbi:hypothetical protein UFOVP1196_24 [uncultured Caudovirales phage]|uniref:Uncharacterized protein n=1 Tax=uncultured Caudovirales phage TaxID=2100421 RepID=A0A6J5R6B0_9CAUD|nr:hypothetical protein UFOVP1196_24 [uncultured Caudovirales phage]
MNEATLKGRLMLALKEELPSAVCIRIEDKFKSGTPDLVVNHNKESSWYEVKYADPKFDSEGIQELTMRKLSLASFHARYIVYDESLGKKRVLIVHPVNIPRWSTHYEVALEGFNHRGVAQYIKGVHA